MAKDELKKEKKSKKRKSEAGEAETAEEKAARKAAKKAKKAAAAAAEAEPEVKKEKKSKKAKKEAAEDEDESPKKKSKKEKKAKKEKVAEEEAEDPAPVAAESSEEEEEEEKMVIKSAPKPGDAAANPTGTTEVFMGNLSFNIDDDSLKEAFKEVGEITNIKWLEDRDTGKFKGCGFISFADADMAAKAVGMSGTEVLGREIKVDFAKGKSNAGGAGGNREVRPMQAKPEGCTTMFAGNLNFNIDDDAMKEFFKGCGEVSSIRWLTDRDSGDFKGCGFIEFSDPESALDKAAALNGSELMGRQIRLDFAAPRAPREKSW